MQGILRQLSDWCGTYTFPARCWANCLGPMRLCPELSIISAASPDPWLGLRLKVFRAVLHTCTRWPIPCNVEDGVIVVRAIHCRSLTVSRFHTSLGHTAVTNPLQFSSPITFHLKQRGYQITLCRGLMSNYIVSKLTKSVIAQDFQRMSTPTVT
jgi:hypothetical protein